MFALFVIFGVLSGTTMVCVAPCSRYEKQVDMMGAMLFIGALASIGVGLATRLAI